MTRPVPERDYQVHAYIYMVTFMRSHARRGIDQSRAVRDTHLIPPHITVVFCISNYSDNDKACP